MQKSYIIHDDVIANYNVCFYINFFFNQGVQILLRRISSFFLQVQVHIIMSWFKLHKTETKVPVFWSHARKWQTTWWAVATKLEFKVINLNSV